MTPYRIAPAASAALAQATLLWPERDRSADGLVGDAAHFNRRSWHNPVDRNGNYVPGGTVCAFDLTHDPARGCDAHALVQAAVARGERRINEAISRGRIWTRERAAEGWRKYSGANRHDHHAHVSVSWEFRTDTAPWWTTPQEEDEMTPEQEARLIGAFRTLLGNANSDKDADPTHDSLADIRRDLREIKEKLGI